MATLSEKMGAFLNLTKKPIIRFKKLKKGELPF
jgi:hypothetical protein